MGLLATTLLLFLAVSSLEARGYYSSTPKETSPPKDSAKIMAKLAKSKTKDPKDPSTNKINKLENSVESSPFLNPDTAASLDPLLTNVAELDVNQQILVQLKEMNEQLAALRRTVSNLKYQGHAQYKYMRRVQASCDTTASAVIGGRVAGAGGGQGQVAAVGDEQSNMIRTGSKSKHSHYSPIF